MAVASCGDRGASLVELLVVVAILAVLALLAVPRYLDQRDAGRQAAVLSDVRSAALLVESAASGTELPQGVRYSGDAVTPEGAVAPLVVTATSPRVVLAYDRDDSVSPARFCLAGAHLDLAGSAEEPVAVYDSGTRRLDADCDWASLEFPDVVDDGPFAFVGRFGEGSSYISDQTAGGGFRTGVHGRELLLDGGDLADGTFSLRRTQASFSHSGGGWAVVVRGEDSPDGFNGYTVQLDRGYAGGEFVVRRWVDGAEQSPVARSAAPEGFDWEAVADVDVAVDGSSVRLDVDGATVLDYDGLTREQGGFGVRTWGGTELEVESSEVTVAR